MVISESLEHWESRIGRRVRLRDLHVLLAVCQWGSMAKAAQHLSVSQPAVSKAIADLEHALGVRLLDRGSRGVAPTVYGQALVRRGAAVFDELRQGVDELAFLASSSSGELRIGCHESLVAAFLPAVIERLGKQHPGVSLHIEQMSLPIGVEVQQLRQRNVDLIVARGLPELPEDDLHAEVLFDEPFVVVAGVHSPWARRRKLELADLAGEKWILYPLDHVPGVLLRQAFRARGMELPRARVYTMSYHLRDMLLMTGEYVTVIAACMLGVFNAKRPTVARLPIDLGIRARSVAIFTLKNRTLGPLAARFSACARDAARAFQWPAGPNSAAHGRRGV